MKLQEFNELHNHKCSEERRYKKPIDPKVLQSLEEFQDNKFGLMMHWGLYSQLGIIESWALPDQDRKWAWQALDKYQHMSGMEFRQMYWDLIKVFNPIEFDPQKWAKMAKQAGFKYYILTTKHHDGFCLWDTKYSDFKITSPQCPYSSNKNADICKVAFDAFRQEGLKINAYFSKPDWHSQYFWSDAHGKKNYRTRMTTYNTFINHKLWKKFVEYTKNQMLELVENYGELDCLWLDGGQVCPAKGMNLNLSDIIDEARKIQPGLMVADRTVGGKNENFLTPEQSVPDHVINVPWESCLTLGTAFSFRENDDYKDARTVIHLLCNIVAKGGNLALNIAPDALGNIPLEVQSILVDIGKWLDNNGYAIYGTRPVAPYYENDMAYTRKNNEVYAIYLKAKEGKLAKQITLCSNKPIKTVLLNNCEIPFIQDGNRIIINNPPYSDDNIADVFTLK